MRAVIKNIHDTTSTGSLGKFLSSTTVVQLTALVPAANNSSSSSVVCVSSAVWSAVWSGASSSVGSAKFGSEISGITGLDRRNIRDDGGRGVGGRDDGGGCTGDDESRSIALNEYVSHRYF